MLDRCGLLAAGTGLVGLGLARPALSQGSKRVLRFIPEGNLANPDPIWTTTTVARNHGYMIYDTLFGNDSKGVPQLQMAEAFDVSPDKLSWRIRLRDRLKFHDGAPVRGADCVASIARWRKRDGMGQRIATQLDDMKPLDDRSFEIRLKRPFPLLSTALVPCIPLGEDFQAIAARDDIAGVLESRFPLFWNVRKT